MSMSALMTALRAAGRKQLSASASSGPRKATGSHVFRIGDYTQVREQAAIGTAVHSSTFGVGGHDWQIQCYPNGKQKEDEDWISVYLRHASHARTGDATAKFEMSILDEAGKLLHRGGWEDQRCFFSSSSHMGWGHRKFIRHAHLHQEKHLKGDSLTLLCDLNVEVGLELDGAALPVSEPAAVAPPPPPFELRGQLAETFWKRHEADLKIEVAGETFPAHRAVLEDQSPVFKADLSALSSATGDKSTLVLTIDDMDADVCKALLQYIYAESAPEMVQLEAMAERLLAAADRYEMEKLKKICEEVLCRNIDMGSVAATLVLAERHGCSVLKDACIQLLSAPGNLEAVMATDGFEQLKTGSPSVLLEIVVKKISGQQQ